MNKILESNINTEMPTFGGVEKRTYKVEELQDILSISRPTAYKLVNSGKFKVIKVGSQIRIPKKSFDEWLDSNF